MSVGDLAKIEKQKYLREKILDKGVPVAEFIQFMQSQKAGGDDIDLWSMDELKEIVDKFLRMQEPVKPGHPTQEKEGTKADTTKPENSSSISPSKDNNEASVSLETIGPRIKIMREYPEEVKTMPLEIGEAGKQKVKIKVTQTSVKEGGIFSSSQLFFVLEIPALKWAVARKYDEVWWFKEQLQRFYPGAIIPPLNKKGLKTKVSTKAVEKRKAWLQKFLDELQRDQMIRSTELFTMFFNTPDRTTFEKKKKDLQKLPTPKGISELKHFGGKAIVGVNPDKEALCKNIGLYAPSCGILYDKLQMATSDLSKIMKTLSDAYAREAEIFKELSMVHATVDCVELADLFNTCRHIMESHQDLYLKHSVKVVDQFSNYFRYFKEELQPIKESFASFEQIAIGFKKKEAKLYAKKDKLFSEANLKAWDVSMDDLKKYNPQELSTNRSVAMTVILPKETKDLEDNYRVYGYYTNKLIEEMKRMTVKNYRRIRKHMQAVSTEYTTIWNSLSEKWNATTEHFGIKVSKKSKETRDELLMEIKKELKAAKPLVDLKEK